MSLNLYMYLVLRYDRQTLFVPGPLLILEECSTLTYIQERLESFNAGCSRTNLRTVIQSGSIHFLWMLAYTRWRCFLSSFTVRMFCKVRSFTVERERSSSLHRNSIRTYIRPHVVPGDRSRSRNVPSL